MTGDRVAAFLAGDRPDDVALYLSDESVSNLDTLLDQPAVQPADDGALLVVDGETGRSVFARFTGEDAMAFTGEAMEREGHIGASLSDGTCPDAGDGEDHVLRFVFAFAEEQNEDVGGLYERGDVMHAYGQCSCGTAYSDTWVVDER